MLSGLVHNRQVLVVMLVAVIFMTTAGGALSSHMMMQDGAMMQDCPFMGVAALCNMSPLQHMAAWQTMFASTAPQLTALLILLVLSTVLSRFLDDFLVRRRSRPRLIFYIKSEVEIFDHVRLALARGLIHPKIY